MLVNKSTSTRQSKVYRMAGIGIMAALMSILGPLSIPIGPVPISLTIFAIYITLYAIGRRDGTLSFLVYMLLGFVGLPVFSGFTSGPGKLVGPTGGYLVGFLFITLISGYFVDRFVDKWYLCVLGMIIGTAICYAFGTMWLAYQANMTGKAALLAGVIPFIPGDLLKIFISAWIGPKIRSRLIKANLY
ncbi:MAG TPA: biotin transporter BioY [Erysipelotrichaceae bacterium]|nr:biotin transporter BioY [Erysipelotrichaceae bacterium]